MRTTTTGKLFNMRSLDDVYNIGRAIWRRWSALVWQWRRRPSCLNYYSLRIYIENKFVVPYWIRWISNNIKKLFIRIKKKTRTVEERRCELKIIINKSLWSYTGEAHAAAATVASDDVGLDLVLLRVALRQIYFPVANYKRIAITTLS